MRLQPLAWLRLSSLTRRLIATVLLIEVALALFVTVAALYYQRSETLRAFDVMLRGRADSVLGSVQDAEDASNNVLLDKTSLETPPYDLYEVQEDNGHFLGRSAASGERLLQRIRDDGETHNFKTHGVRYRGLVMHGSRRVDAEDGTGVVHRVVILYASPIRPVWLAVQRAARFFALADLLAVLLSIAAVALLIRRSLRPLDDLALRAAAISPRSWSFEAPPSAYALRELAPLASALDTALQGLERAFQQQRNFVNDAAHELKTAVTVLKSSLQLLNFRDRTPREYQQGIELCLSDTGRMEDLVQHMLMLARLEQKPETETRVQARETVRLADSIRQVVDQLEPAASVRRLRLSTELTGAGAVALSAEDAFTLLANLVMNAIQHSPAASIIVVRLAESGENAAVLAVSDAGEGIAPEHLPLVFERFYRADASRSRDTGGTGLGLAICKAIVESAGGSIAIESRLGEGTIVTVRMPIVAGPVQPETRRVFEPAAKH